MDIDNIRLANRYNSNSQPFISRNELKNTYSNMTEIPRAFSQACKAYASVSFKGNGSSAIIPEGLKDVDQALKILSELDYDGLKRFASSTFTDISRSLSP